jgi:hypothetical protein
MPNRKFNSAFAGHVNALAGHEHCPLHHSENWATYQSNQSRKEKYEQNITCSRAGLLRKRVLVSIADVEDAHDGWTFVGSRHARFQSSLRSSRALPDGGFGHFGPGLLHLRLDAKGREPCHLDRFSGYCDVGIGSGRNANRRRYVLAAR